MIAAAPAPVRLQRTPLAAFHLRHGAHLVPFAGWEMPLYYTSILTEHRAVREGVGLFDVSHMGVLSVSGDHAAELLARRTTANVPRLTPGQVRYTFFLEGTGGIVDDLLVSRLDDGTSLAREYLAVPNAGRADEVEEILRQHRLPDTTLIRWNGKTALLAVQGPRSRELLERTFGWDLSGLGFYRTAWFPSTAGDGDVKGRLGRSVAEGLPHSHLVSRTGYTGERGYEIVLRAEEADAIAERLKAGGAVLCGLAARDTLRLEQGYLLSGQEFHRDHTPLEAGQDRFVEFDHEFVGRTLLEKQRDEGPAVRLVGLEVRTPGAIPRHGTPVRIGETVVSAVTSGGLSPTLNYGIALAYLPRDQATPGTEVTLSIRGTDVPARVVSLPFRTAPKAG
ncbi:MAG: glycine cleavage system aminomethyltransferase GcvT [Thermoplasmata archaeon]|nr:glycine cleavage system aminomethyltransferase GcvT [Thermoplasmata archaeon]